MNFATNHITDPFKRTFLRAQDDNEFAQAQRLMFKLGFKWVFEGVTGREVKECNGRYLMVDNDCRIWWCDTLYPPYNEQPEQYREITVYDLRQAADQVKVIRKARKKDQRKRKAEKSALHRDGWIVVASWDDVPRNEQLNVVFSDKSSLASWMYQQDTTGYPIPARVKRLTKQPEKVSVQTMVQDIVQDSGMLEVQHVDKDGFIRWTGEGYMVDDTTYEPGGMHGPVKEGTKVDVKMRNGEIHKCQTAGAGGNASGWYWVNEGVDNDIVAYRLCPTVTPAPEPEATAEEEEAFKAVPEVRFVGDVPAEATAPDTNPKRQYGLASVPLNLWSPLASAYGAVSLYNGSLKYGRGNYKATPVEASIYIAAALRHLLAFAEGEEFDPADGCPNLGGVLANVAILLDARANGTLIDDRQIPSGYLKEREMLKALVVKLQEVHAGKDPRHYTIADAK